MNVLYSSFFRKYFVFDTENPIDDFAKVRQTCCQTIDLILIDTEMGVFQVLKLLGHYQPN